MFKQCNVYNLLSGEIFYGQVDTELEGVEGYPYREATLDEIENYMAVSAKEARNKEIYMQIDENQKKYLRSLVYPGYKVQPSDENPNGITWSEFYQLEDSRLRSLLI